MTVDSQDEVFTIGDEEVKAPPKDPLPITFCVAGRLQGQPCGKSYVCLLDSGSTSSWMNKKSMPKGIHGYTVDAVEGQTLAGTFTSKEQVCLQDLILPEFQPKQCLPKTNLKVFGADCRYDMILGRDVLRAFGIRLDFETNTIVAGEVSRPMRDFPEQIEGMKAIDVLLHEYLDDLDPVINDEDDSSDNSEEKVLEDGFADILESKYDKVTPEDIVAKCTHLTKEQRDDLAKLFSKFETLFDGNLRKFTDERIHLEIEPNVQPKRSRPYAVPRNHLEIFKKELDRLVAIGVLEKCGRADWVSGTFIIPKKVFVGFLISVA